MTIDAVQTWPDATYRQQAALVQTRIVRAITRATASPIDLRTRRVVTTCFDEFVGAGLRPAVALKVVAPMMEELGAAQARLGRTRRELDVAFARVHEIVIGALAQFAGGRLAGPPMLALRRDVKIYLDGLYRQLGVGMARESAREDWSRAHREAMAGTAVRSAEAGPAARVRVVISIGTALPESIMTDARLVAGRSQFEVLVPEDVDPADLESRIIGQAVLGPLTSWHEVDESAALGWRAAALMREGRADDPRRLVPCSDLLSALLVSSSSVMTRLLAEKHLGPMVDLTPRRRRELSSTMLAWLERGVAGNALAREMGVPPQTVHHRLKQLRELFGCALEDPSQRLELIVALRATEPEWSTASGRR